MFVFVVVDDSFVVVGVVICVCDFMLMLSDFCFVFSPLSESVSHIYVHTDFCT